MKLKINKVKVRDAERITNKGRIYFFHKGENIIDNLVNRWGRPYKAYRTLLPDVFKKAGFDPVKDSWSQRAGCECGCSPGFILDGKQAQGYEIFVDISAK